MPDKLDLQYESIPEEGVDIVTLAEDTKNSVQNEKTDNQDKVNSHPKPDLLYTIEDLPSWKTCIMLGLQHYLTMAGSALGLVTLLSSLMCINVQDPTRGAILSTTFFVSGITSLLQTTLGVRLPIVQGSNAGSVVTTATILSLYFGTCPDLTDTEYEKSWQARLSEVSGDIAVASLLQVILGWSGAIGFLIRWISPLVIVPTVALIGLSLIDMASSMASQNWVVAFMTMILILLFSQYLENTPIPVPRWKKAITRVYIFRLFPVLLSVVISWLLCYLLTIFDFLPEGNKARTDLNHEILSNAPWFIFPYPGQFGKPTVSLAGVLGSLAAVVASILESVGDYHACARIAGAPPPPANAINRGIFIEGLGAILASLSGTGSGATSYSQNTAVIAITKVGSRRVVQCSAMFMILFGMLGKVGAILVMIPEPIVGGLLCSIFAVIIGVAFTNLHHVNMNSSRSILILGSSIFLGLMVPKWLASDKEIMNTGSYLVDQALSILLKAPMIVGGGIAFILDNTIPGTRSDRGLSELKTSMNKPCDKDLIDERDLYEGYNLPFGMDFIRRHKWLRHIPVSPTFTGGKVLSSKSESTKNEQDDLSISTTSINIDR